MKNKHLLAIFSLLLISFSACRNTDKINADTTDSTIAQVIPDTADINRGGDMTAFLQEAATDGMMELALAKLAAEKSTNKLIKRYGAVLVKDHTKIAAELKTLAASKKIALPATLPPADLKHIEELKKMDVAAFENHYIKMMIKDNAAAIDLYKSASVSGDVQIRSFATKALRMSERHFKRANEINADAGY
ncbi:DUF4142 domain-containing protein [Pedobacter sp. PLR]|uniref:DUF4142 domain-containing protein n=1 Tax=Pedobacter sp. PLR TaxID=2994465 RepID=UPI002246DB67|nr:DUF4142 domain-containing protein [Pedobacter sp. PLR]MCX2450189.1 DUF4142 domain-containing protein [Pedobacter sp. PLR]